MASETLLRIHRFLYPERYANVPLHEWEAETIEIVAGMVEEGLQGNPEAKLQPRDAVDAMFLRAAEAEVEGGEHS